MSVQTLSRRGQAFHRVGKAIPASEATRESIEARLAARRGTSIGFMDWALKVPEPKAGRLNFEAFPFQIEMYSEGVHDKEAVVMKATQVGMSAFSTRWAMYHADTRGRTGLYVFPTKGDMNDFSSLRIKPMIEGSPYLKARQRPDDPDNKGMKGVGLGMVVFRGSESKTGLDSVDCDHIVFDEYDTLEHKNIPDAEMRVSSPLSPGLIRRIGVPSVPDWGIHKLYADSDQRRWMVKCHACNHWQALDFFENVDFETATRVCSKCHKSIEGDIAAGRWVAEYPDSGRPRGYHVTRLIAPGADIRDVIVKSKKRNPSEKTVFFNKHLGIPFVPEEGRLSKEAIAAAQSRGGGYVMAPGYTGANLVTMGIDVADVRAMSVRISEHIDDERKRALWIGEVERFFEYEAGEGPSLESLMNRFGVHMAAIDHEPSGRTARAFAEKFRGLVYVVAYSGTTAQPEVLKVDDDMMTATIKRTQAIDATFELIRQQKNLLPLDLPEGYVEQMGSLVRFAEQDEVGKKKTVYRKMGPADDYAHAEVFDVIAGELWLHRQVKSALESEEDTSVDEMVEGFERSRLQDYVAPEDYYAGGRDDMEPWDRGE